MRFDQVIRQFEDGSTQVAQVNANQVFDQPFSITKSFPLHNMTLKPSCFLTFLQVHQRQWLDGNARSAVHSWWKIETLI